MFPACFPENFETELLPITQEDSKELDVYRIIKRGVLNREAFIGSMEESERGLVNKKYPPHNCGSYGTSCNENLEEIYYLIDTFMSKKPKVEVAKGKTVVCCGPSQRTKDRDPSHASEGHVDWWIYDEAQPQEHFELIERRETQ